MTRTNWLWMSLMLVGCLEAPTATPADITPGQDMPADTSADMPADLPGDASEDIPADAPDDLPPDSTDMPPMPGACEDGDDVFTVSDAEEFRCMLANHLGQAHTFYLLNDIAFEDQPLEMGVGRFETEPVGCRLTAEESFQGTVQSMGNTPYSITGVRLSTETSAPVGLFHNVMGATFKNFNVSLTYENTLTQAEAPHASGGLVGCAKDLTVEGVSVEVEEFSAKHVMGGVVGYLEGTSTFKKVSVEGRITAVNTNAMNAALPAHVGGIAGLIKLELGDTVLMEDIDVSTLRVNNLNTEPTTLMSAGGLIGRVEGPGDLTFQKQLQVGILEGKDNTGGLLGVAANRNVNVSTEDITMNSITGRKNVGGLFGSILSLKELTLPNALDLSMKRVEGTHTVGGLAGLVETTDLSGINIDNVIVRGEETVGGVIGQLHHTDTDFPMNVSNTIVGAGTQVVGSKSVGGAFGASSGNITLSEAEVSASVKGKDNIGGVVGVVHESPLNPPLLEKLHGKGSIQSNLELPTTNIGGLIGWMTTGVLQHSTSDTTIALNNGIGVGGLVGRAEGPSAANKIVVKTSSTMGNGPIIRGEIDVGGLLGVADNVRIENCYSRANLEAISAAGGLVARANSSVSIHNSYAAFNLSGNSNDSLSGGLVGVSESTSNTIVGSYYEGRLLPGSGGIVGQAANAGPTTNSAFWDMTDNTTNCYAVSSSFPADSVCARRIQRIDFRTYFAQGWDPSIWMMNAANLPTLHPPTM